MPSASAASLVDALRQLRLLEPAQLEELVRGMAGRFPEPKALAGELLRRGWLTPYQVNQLLQGRGSDLLLGSYVILERLGEGGMGQVFKARHQKMGRIVALKLIRKDRLTKPDAIRRFEREIRAAAQLSHPNVVTAHDAAQVGDTHFFVMEYVEGIDLAKLVKDTGPLPVEQACAYIRQAALGLEHAHEKGLVHRDIKPSNLLLAVKEGTVKVLDMGVARMLRSPETDDTASLTEDGLLVGTPDYEAPEQARQSNQVDIRADLYSLGCTLYFLLTGRPPFPGGTVGEKLVKHQLDEPEPVEKLNPEVTAPVARIARKLMAKRPEDRYQDPAELITALDELHFGAASTQRIPKPPGIGIATRVAPQGSNFTLRILRRHPYYILALMVSVVIGLVGWFALARASRVHPILGYELKKHPADAVAFKGHWYAYYPEKLPSWNEAKRRCQDLGGYLACSRSPQDQEFLLRLTNRQNAWLGGFNDDKSKWFWITGEPITEFYWAPTQPDDGPNVFLQLMPIWRLSKDDKCWGDISRKDQLVFSAGFICQWDF
jgi:serine/threonine-protein kinase